MNYKEIENLKCKLTELLHNSCKIKIPAYGIDGSIIGVGFKPYWTNPIDTRIDKLEFNILDNHGRVIPFNFKYITGYDILPNDDNPNEKFKNFNLDVILFSPNKARGGEVNEKIRIEITS